MTKKEDEGQDKDSMPSSRPKDEGKKEDDVLQSQERREFIKAGLSGIVLLPYVAPIIISYAVTSSYAEEGGGRGRGRARARARARRITPWPREREREKKEKEKEKEKE
ncbi:MAG: hypothetical protein HY739_09205 [Desulfobacterales bacterium]|nr:hypothetical protein [Desulfobacterales bacterium]